LASSPCAASASSYHFSSSASPPWRSAFSQFAPVVNLGLPVLASGSNCAVKPTRLRRAAYFRSLVPSTVLCAQPLVPALSPTPKAFKPFWPPALVQQAPPAIILAALRRFRGPALFRGLRPSPRLGASFWPSGLTLRSSRPAYGGRLTLAVSTTENQFISPMFIQTAFNFSSVVQRLVCRFSGLRLLASRGFLVFLASGPCAASARSYCFRSAVPPRWRSAFSQFVPVAKSKLPVLASGSNISVKPTRLRRSAYLAR
jgi:hypothetical protein